MTGRLTLIPTPIGNLNDISPRVREVLAKVDMLACEDTRRTGELLAKLGIKTPPLMSFYKDVEITKEADILTQLAHGRHVGLVSDGGMPAISDPGARVVSAARKAGFAVDVLAGPSAVPMLVAGSGFDGPFLFHGFFPRKAGEQKALLTRLKDYPETLVFYESPHRVTSTILVLLDILDNRYAYLARELTKLHEEWLGPDLTTITQALAERGEVKGECAIVVQGYRGDGEKTVVSDIDISAQLTKGLSTKDTAAWLADMEGISKKEAYERVLLLRQGVLK